MPPIVLSGAGIISGGGGGGPLTELAQAVNATSPGDWNIFTVSNTYDTDPGDVTGVNNSSWLYSPQLLWSPFDNKLFHNGGIHDQDFGQPDNEYHVVGVYGEVANAWAAGEQVPVIGNFAHGYCMGATDEAGNLYLFTYNNDELWVRRANGDYEQLATCPNRYNITCGLAFNPNMGTQGGLVMGDGLYMYWYDIAGDVWNTIIESGSLLMGEYSQYSAYVPAHDACYIGGGQGDNIIQKVNAAASRSVIATAPRFPFSGSFGGGGGVDSLNILTSTTTSGLLLLSIGRNEYYEFDGSSWSGNLGTLDAGLLSAGGSEDIIACGSVPAHGAQLYDAIVFGYLTSQSAHDPATTFYVWRP